MRDFTLDAYKEILLALFAVDLPVFGVAAWIREQPTRGAVIRHDVDRRPLLALRMAEAEAALGLKTTYYFRASPSSFSPAIIAQVNQLGHEVGYHYEDLSACRGSITDAIASFRQNLAALRKICPVTTAAMHGSPLSPFNNLALWNSIQPDALDLIGEAFLSIDYQNIHYFTDTGRSWGASKTNLRDHPRQALVLDHPLHSTRELCDFIRNGSSQRLAICAHPERWDTTLSGWLGQAVKDIVINTAKFCLQARRSLPSYHAPNTH